MCKVLLLLFFIIELFVLDTHELNVKGKVLEKSKNPFFEIIQPLSIPFDSVQPKFNICTICVCSRRKLSCNIVNGNEIFPDLQHSKNLMLYRNNFKFLEETVRSIQINFEYSITKLMMNKLAFLNMVKLHKIDIEHVYMKYMVSLNNSKYLEEVTIKHSNLRFIDDSLCSNKAQLYKIEFNSNDIENDNLDRKLDDCKYLKMLDLSNNRFKKIGSLFSVVTSIQILILDYNSIESINDTDFENFPGLKLFSIAYNKLKIISDHAFVKQVFLEGLNLEGNLLKSLPQANSMYANLRKFNVYGNEDLLLFPQAKYFKKIKVLHLHYSYHCCPFVDKEYIEESKANGEYSHSYNDRSIFQIGDVTYSINKTEFNNIKCKEDIDKLEYHEILICERLKPIYIDCTPAADILRPCENLLGDKWLRIAVWIISILGILCNLCVILVNIIDGINSYRHNMLLDVPIFLLTNLAIADLFMSIYLFFIAIKDHSSRDHFDKLALVWQHSFTCNLAGFISILSFLSSALSLSFITFERFYSIKHSLNFSKRITIKVAILITSNIWLISSILASMPLIKINNYSSYAICLPLDTNTKKSKIFLISLIALILICFLFISVCYVLLFFSTVNLERRSSSSSCSSDEQTKIRCAEGHRLARNISMLVFTNIICWGPLITFVICKAFFFTEINRGWLKLMAVFIIPLNSLINPILYCLSQRRFRHYLVSLVGKMKVSKKISACNSSGYHSSSYHSYHIKLRNSDQF